MFRIIFINYVGIQIMSPTKGITTKDICSQLNLSVVRLENSGLDNMTIEIFNDAMKNLTSYMMNLAINDKKRGLSLSGKILTILDNPNYSSFSSVLGALNELDEKFYSKQTGYSQYRWGPEQALLEALFEDLSVKLKNSSDRSCEQLLYDVFYHKQERKKAFLLILIPIALLLGKYFGLVKLAFLSQLLLPIILGSFCAFLVKVGYHQYQIKRAQGEFITLELPKNLGLPQIPEEDTSDLE